MAKVSTAAVLSPLLQPDDFLGGALEEEGLLAGDHLLALFGLHGLEALQHLQAAAPLRRLLFHAASRQVQRVRQTPAI